MVVRVSYLPINLVKLAPTSSTIISGRCTFSTVCFHSLAKSSCKRNGVGTAGANFTHPLKSTTVDPNAHTFVSLPSTFKGRVQRGTTLPATWAEFQLDASNDHAAHGDISLEQGCDGAATIAATDGSKRSNGFTQDILKDAPAAAIVKKPDGEKALASTMGNWMGPPNHAAIEYEEKVVGREKAYITGGTGVPDVASSNQVLAVDFY